jgi:CRP-like cAMP-binding protein
MKTPKKAGAPPLRASHDLVSSLLDDQPAAATAVAATMLAERPRDLRAWHLLGRSLVAADERELGAEVLEALALAYVGVADVPQAIVAALEAEEAGADPSAALTALAACCSAAAQDLVDDWRPQPPPVPFGGAVDLEQLPDAAALATLARAALERAVAASEAASEGPRRFFPLLSSLGTEAFLRFARSLEVERRSRGEVVIDQGELGDGFFVIASGEVHVLRSSGSGEDQLLARLGPGAFFGEMAIVARAPRAARVRAESDVVLLHADMGTVEVEMRAVPELREVLRAFCRARMLENVVAASKILRRAQAEDRSKNLERFRESAHAKGEVIIEEGEDSPGLFLILSGQVLITRQEQGGEILTLATLAPGDFFGEISLVLRRPAVATVKALSDTVCLFLPREEFLATVKAHPELLSELYATALERDEETASILAREAESADDLVLI